MSVSQQISELVSSVNSGPLGRLQRGNNGLPTIPISMRLTLGFLAAALIASLITSIVGIQHLQVVSQQAAFYRNLLNKTAELASSADDLQFMSTEIQLLLNEVHAPDPSQETIDNTLKSINIMSSSYNYTLHDYLNYQLADHYTNQATLFSEDTWNMLAAQQRILTMSTLHSWESYRSAQQQILLAFEQRNISQAIQFQRLQAEPLHSDALSALQQLLHFHRSLADTVGNAASVAQHDQLLITIASSLVVFFCIVAIGWSITHTLIPPLRRLQRVAQAAEDGNLEDRIPIHGRDEIAQVSLSVNTMLETLVADKQIALAYEQQRQLNQLKDQFLLNVSHELRTPLTQVFGYLELLSTYHSSLDDTTQTAFINNAKDGCQELMQLVTTVLDATSVKSDIKPPTIEKVAVGEEISSVLAAFAPDSIQAYDLHLEIPTGCVVEADRAYFRQVIRNLVSNVFKYAPPQTSLNIRAVQSGEQILISIKDAGPGIPATELPLLFQKFVRLQRDLSGNVRGTGLGLYISHRLIDSMKGRIWAESSGIRGEGSCFNFTLPGGIEQ